MRNLLRKAGFRVTILENARKIEMVNAIRSFGRSLRKSDAALFYFSGHGNQYNSRNWLIPIGADIQRESDLEFEAYNAERVLAEMEGGSNKRVNIVMFDACRSNRSFRSLRSAKRGLAQPRVQPDGSIVAFSTAPGTVAYDGEGRNSPYVAELSKHMLTPGLKIEDVFKRVRVGVKRRTARKPSPQIPWENSAMTGDFYFVSPQGGVTTTVPSYTETNTDKQMWELIESSNNPAEFESFLKEFPNSQYSPLARIKLKRLTSLGNNKYANMIKDPSTGLIWANVSAEKKFNFRSGQKFCNNLDLGGLAWRLPVSGEIKTLDDQNVINIKGTGTYWTRSPSIYADSSDTEETIRAQTGYFLKDYFTIFDTGELLSEFHRIKCVSHGPKKVKIKKEKRECHRKDSKTMSRIMYGTFDAWLDANSNPWESYAEIVKKFEERFDCKLTKTDFSECQTDENGDWIRDENGDVRGVFTGTDCDENGNLIESGDDKKKKGVLYLSKRNGEWGWYKSGDEKVDSKYVGEVENGVPNGQGTETFASGNKYVGEYKDDEMNGQGTYSFPNGTKAVGDFREGRPWNITEYGIFGKIIGKYDNGVKEQ